MKKIFSFLVLTLALGTAGQAQSGFGLKAGYALITAKAESEGISASTGESGFFVGVTGELKLSEAFAIQPEALYARAAGTAFLYIPIMAEVYVTPQFSLQAGPQVNLVLDAGPEEKDFGFDLAFGLGYSIDDNFFVDAHHAFELTNRLSDDFGYNLKASYNTLMVGVGHKF